MESETKTNKAHHQNGQQEPLDPVKIATNRQPFASPEINDYWLKCAQLK